MDQKLRVGILGATGMVGQRFISLLENHPWFEVVTLAASPRSAGKTYEEAVGDRWKMDTPMPEAVKKIVVHNVNEVEEVAKTVDFVFSAVDMSKDEIRAIEEAYAKTETPVVSNNSAHRWTPDVPMVIPEVNPEHFAVIEDQKKRLGTTRGFIAVKPNCSIQSYAPCLAAWKEFGPKELVVTKTYNYGTGARTYGNSYPGYPSYGGYSAQKKEEPKKENSSLGKTSPLVQGNKSGKKRKGKRKKGNKSSCKQMSMSDYGYPGYLDDDDDVYGGYSEFQDEYWRQKYGFE